MPQENTCGYGARVSGAMFYNYFRSYDSRTGRYSQPDPIGLDGDWNRFGYVDANPLLFVDPTGLIKLYESEGGVTFHSYPGPQAGGRENMQGKVLERTTTYICVIAT